MCSGKVALYQCTSLCGMSQGWEGHSWTQAQQLAPQKAVQIDLLPSMWHSDH